MAESKLNDIIQTSLASIKEVVDANTIIGQPIEAANGSGTAMPRVVLTISAKSLMRRPRIQ